MVRLAKFFLYPILLPVIALYELGRWAWSKVRTRYILVCLLAFFFGPTLSIALSIEVASYFWAAGTHWSISILSAIASLFMMLGVIWPIAVLMLQPLVELLAELLLRTGNLCISFATGIFDVLAHLGSFSPMASYWRGARANPFQSSVFLNLLVIFSQIMLLTHSTLLLYPLWRVITDSLTVFSITLVSQIFVIFWLLSIPVGLVGITAVATMAQRRVSFTIGTSSLAAVVEIIFWTSLRNKQWSELLPAALLCYFLLALVILPVIDSLTRRNFMKRLILIALDFFTKVLRYSHTAWTSAPAVDWALLTFIPLITSMSIYYLSRAVGLNSWLALAHIALFVAIESCGVESPHITFTLATASAIHLGIERFAPSHIVAWSRPFGIVGFLPILIVSASVANGVVMPILFPIMSTLQFLLNIIPASISGVAPFLRRQLKTGLSSIIRRISDAMHGIFFDRSSFGTMVGWLLTAVIVILASVASLLSASASPLAYIPSRAWSLMGPGIFSMSFNSTNSLNLTATLNSSIDILQTPNITQAASPAFNLCGSPWIDSLVTLIVAANVLILVGKLASQGGAVAFCIYSGLTFFLYLRHLPWLQTFYPIITTMVTAELALLSTLIAVLFIYGGLLALTRPYVPKYAPIICIPFERLFSMQRWALLVTVQKWVTLWTAITAVWHSLFHPSSHTANTAPKPLYVRPRRYQ